jgi:nucleoside-diphosphate-sugar epimerase
MGMKILITGATGFVGQHLYFVSLGKGYSITVIVRTLSDARKFPPSSELIFLNSINSPIPDTALDGVDVVIHLAARAHILDDLAADPEAEFFQVNTQGTINLAQAAIAAGVKHFIFISSIGAMATTSSEILTESSPCNPDTSYGRSKLAAEKALIELCQNSSMAWTIIRPTLVYGKGNPGNMERLIKLINSGLPLPIAAIHNRRSFTYVGNLVDCILTCTTHPNAKNQTFLISDGEDVSTPQLARAIAKNIQKPCRLLPVPTAILEWGGKLGDQIEKITDRSIPINSNVVQKLSGSLQVDISHLRNTLNWQPPYTLSAGLKQTLS